jgi:hypothetical protein
MKKSNEANRRHCLKVICVREGHARLLIELRNRLGDNWTEKYVKQMLKVRTREKAALRKTSNEMYK